MDATTLLYWGISILQGVHHDAQKSITVDLALEIFRFEIATGNFDQIEFRHIANRRRGWRGLHGEYDDQQY